MSSERAATNREAWRKGAKKNGVLTGAATRRGTLAVGY